MLSKRKPSPSESVVAGELLTEEFGAGLPRSMKAEDIQKGFFSPSRMVALKSLLSYSFNVDGLQLSLVGTLSSPATWNPISLCPCNSPTTNNLFPPSPGSVGETQKIHACAFYRVLLPGMFTGWLDPTQDLAVGFWV